MTVVATLGRVPSPGAGITTLRAVRRSGGGPSGLGTLGFLAARAGARDWSRLLLVSSGHVLTAHGAGAGDPVYQPAYRTVEDRLEFELDPQPVATVADAVEEDRPYRYAGEPEQSYFVDCATAALLGKGRVGQPRGPVLFRSVARASRLDARPGGGIGVYKLGRDPGVTGRLVATDATVTMADGTSRTNNLVIRGLLRCPGGTRAPFASVGDSGALVLDQLHRAVGLLWGVKLGDPSEAYACHLHPVLHHLGLEPYRHSLAAS